MVWPGQLERGQMESSLRLLEGEQYNWDDSCTGFLATSRIMNGSVAKPGRAAVDDEELKTS